MWFDKEIDTAICEIKQKLSFKIVLYEKAIKVWLSLSTRIMDYYDDFHFFTPPFHIFQILHNNHKLLGQSEKGLIVTLKLGVYKFNTVYLI